MTSLSSAASRRRGRAIGAAGFALATVLSLSACSDDSVNAAPETTVSAPVAVGAAQSVLVDPIEGQALIAEGGVTIIDVRTAPEFAAGHLEDAINIDVESGAFSAGIADLDPSAMYVVYCQSGRRSAIAAAAMVEAGFTQVYDMGGIQDWMAAGLPVVAG